MNSQKAPAKISFELFNTMGLSLINYCSFVFNEEFSTKKNFKEFAILYNGILRTCFNFKMWYKRSEMYNELRLPSPNVLVDANLLGVISRVKRAYKGDLIDKNHV